MRYDITTYNINVLADYNGPKRVLVLADIHDDINKELMFLLNNLDFEAIFIPGDLCNKHIDGGIHIKRGQKQYTVSPKGMQFLKACVEKAPTYYSKGNHEWMYDEKDIKAIRNVGVTFLENEYIRLSCNVLLGAVASPLTYVKNGIFPEYHNPNIEWLKDFEKNQGYKILLCHHPEYYSAFLKNIKIDLIISGHAHGGQIRIGKQGLFAPGQGMFPRFTSGYIDGKMIISRGMTNTIKFIPRIANRPEVVILQMD